MPVYGVHHLAWTEAAAKAGEPDWLNCPARPTAPSACPASSRRRTPLSSRRPRVHSSSSKILWRLRGGSRGSQEAPLSPRTWAQESLCSHASRLLLGFGSPRSASTAPRGGPASFMREHTTTAPKKPTRSQPIPIPSAIGHMSLASSERSTDPIQLPFLTVPCRKYCDSSFHLRHRSTTYGGYRGLGCQDVVAGNTPSSSLRRRSELVLAPPQGARPPQRPSGSTRGGERVPWNRGDTTGISVTLCVTFWTSCRRGPQLCGGSMSSKPSRARARPNT
jgi:hypothetical protein